MSSSGRRRIRDRDRRVFTPRRVRRIEGGVLLLLATVGIIIATLRPTTASAAHLCVVCGPHAAVDAVVNVLLFVPIGAGLALLGVRWRTAILIGAAATIVIETLQLALPIGRVASVSDLITNAAGTAIGFYLSENRRAIAYPRSRAALQYAIGISVAWLILLVATAIAFRPSLPEGRYVAAWAPTLDHFDHFTGEVSASHVSGVAIGNGVVAESDRLHSALSQEIVVEATIAPTGSPLRIAPIVRLVNADSDEVLLLAQRRGDLLFRSRVLGTDMRFYTPMVVMGDALSAQAASGRTVLVAGGTRERGELRAGALGREAVLELHAGAGWLLLLPPLASLQESADAVSAIWAGLPLFTAGYWVGRRARRRARRAGDTTRLRGASGQILLGVPMLMGLAIAGLSGISALFDLAQPSLVVWMGAVIGIGAGLATGASLALSRDHRTRGSSQHGTTTGETRSPQPQTASA